MRFGKYIVISVYGTEQDQCFVLFCVIDADDGVFAETLSCIIIFPYFSYLLA